MKLKYLLAVLLLATVMGGKAQAESPFDPAGILDKPKPKIKIIKYTVKENDTLNSIAKKYHTTWKRLYYKNTFIKDPNQIKVNQTLSIPSKSEKLKKRKLPNFNTEMNPGLPQDVHGKLLGSIGYANPYGNCVLEPGVNNPGWGNPIDWPILSTTPTIGSTALWTYNHTGVVTGIWSNGDIEVRHQNYPGGQHRFPASSFRGFR